MFGTGVIGGLAAWPVAILLMHQDAAQIAFYAYIVPFLISTVCGSIIAGVVIALLQRSGAFKRFHQL